MELQGERLIEASRVHARPFSGGVGTVVATAGRLTGHTGELHQPAAAGLHTDSCRWSLHRLCLELATAVALMN